MSQRPRIDWLETLTAAAAFAVVVFLVVPLQSYLANSASFSFGLGEFFADAAPTCLVAFAVASVVLAACSRFGWRLPQLVLLAVAVCVILETGPLSIGLPEFDGRYSLFKSHSRQVWDLAVWIAVIAAVIAGRKALRDYVPWVALAVTFYSAATVFDVRTDPDAQKDFSRADGYLMERMMSHETVAHNIGFSAKRNVFVLIVDSVSTDLAAEMFRREPSVAAKFDGFVDFENNLGMHWPTRVAIPGIFTGQYMASMKDPTSPAYLDYCRSYLKKGSMLEDYLAADLPTFMMLDIGFGGYASRTDESTNPREDAAPSRRMTGALAWSVGEISVFRAMPYVGKRHYLRRVVRRWGKLKTEGYSTDAKLWPYLATRPVHADWPMALHVYHTWGIHVPISFGRKGEAIKASDGGSREDFLNATAFVLEQVGGFFDALRAKGLYDSSVIFVLADHGVNTTGTGLRANGVPERAFPLLMAKPAQAHGALRFSSAPTTHAKLADVVRASRTQDLSAEAIERGLVQEVRLARDGEKGTLVDWRMKADGSVERTEREEP